MKIEHSLIRWPGICSLLSRHDRCCFVSFPRTERTFRKENKKDMTAYLPGPIQFLIADVYHGLQVARLRLALVQTAPESFELGHIGGSNKQATTYWRGKSGWMDSSSKRRRKEAGGKMNQKKWNGKKFEKYKNIRENERQNLVWNSRAENPIDRADQISSDQSKWRWNVRNDDASCKPIKNSTQEMKNKPKK
jgi:hypothetical protein